MDGKLQELFIRSSGINGARYSQPPDWAIHQREVPKVRWDLDGNDILLVATLDLQRTVLVSSTLQKEENKLPIDAEDSIVSCCSLWMGNRYLLPKVRKSPETHIWGLGIFVGHKGRNRRKNGRLLRKHLGMSSNLSSGCYPSVETIGSCTTFILIDFGRKILGFG